MFKVEMTEAELSNTRNDINVALGIYREHVAKLRTETGFERLLQQFERQIMLSETVLEKLENIG
jgi:hypothetical protein